MDEDDDYMSDKFLAQTESTKSSLLWGNHARNHSLEKKRKQANEIQKKKTLPQAEIQKRDEGLQTKIGQENKGFALLQKMGYKSGEGLGKNKSGRVEPIPIAVKANKAGLGKEAHERRKRDAQERFISILQAKKKRYNENMQTDYRSRMRGKFNERQFESDLYKCQKVCYQLHCENGIDDPEFQFFWPSKAVVQEDDGDEEPIQDEYSVADKLYILTKYLREEYFYCLWCATRYHSAEDLNQNCPGDTAQEHDD